MVFTDGVPGDELPAHYALGDVFAMPCRTRGAGLDVEGLGIVYLEASATGVPVVAGGPAGRPRRSATARPVWWSTAGTSARSRRGQRPARRPGPAARMGEAGRRWVVDNWQWSTKAKRLAELL